MNRPKDDSSNPATLARLSINARNREAASLACRNAKAQEREALNIFSRLPLAVKRQFIESLGKAAPARPPIQSRAVATLAQAIRQAGQTKTTESGNKGKDGKNEKTENNF